MRIRDYLTRVLPRIPQYAAIRKGRAQPVNPLTVTFSVTAACQSRCRTCNIGKLYLENPAIAEQNLDLDEIEAVFNAHGSVYFFNVSGGEPFMRPDLAEIIRLACIHLKPHLIHIPTNAIMPEAIGKTTRRILAYMDRYAGPSVPISIKPSVDGVGAGHDHIRGFEGNFKLLQKTIDLLIEIGAENPRLHVDLGTVISKYNIDHLEEIENWVHKRGVESYRHEIAEERVEFHNLGDPITPSVEEYEAIVDRFKQKIIKNLKGKARLTHMTEAIRLVYYDLAVRILKQKRQVSPCYGGISNIHINYDGEVWPCCVLGGEQAMGNIRDCHYDMHRLLGSERAKAVRRYIADRNCACPLANQWLNNILLTPRHMIKAFYLFVKHFYSSGQKR